MWAAKQEPVAWKNIQFIKDLCATPSYDNSTRSEEQEGGCVRTPRIVIKKS